MTRSSGGTGRQPNRPYRDGDSQRDPMASSDGYEDNGRTGAPGRSRPARRSPAQAPVSDTHEGQSIDPKKRGIALMGDVMLAFGLSLIIVPMLMLLNYLIPQISKLLTQESIIITIMLIRDYFYQGRGFGKNLMGLQVVDATSGTPPTILQSVKRNILFFIPLIVMGILALIRFLPLGANINGFVFQVVNWVFTAYVIILIPAECWLAYTKSDGRRIGDKLANTMVVESSMDFSKPL